MFYARILGTLLFAFEVSSWTVDLPEARKFLFEKNDRLEKHREEVRKDYEKKNDVFFSNRFDSNSKHHEDSHDESYAKEYGYTTYIEKKGIVHDGGAYLEGLRRSLETFSRRVMNCTTTLMNGILTPLNATDVGPGINSTGFNLTGFNSTGWGPAVERVNVTYNDVMCKEASRASEHVRRLAELATKAVEELRDLAYSRKHMKDDPHEIEKQENELILKLAWFLERLSRLTGYSPRAALDDNDDYSSTTTATVPPPPVPTFPPEATRRAMDCLKQKSDVPATVRCAVPNPLPPTNQTQGDQSSSSDRQERRVPSYHDLPPQPRATSEQELLIATEERPYRYLSYYTHVKKRSAPEYVTTENKMTDQRVNKMAAEGVNEMAAERGNKMAAEGVIKIADDPTTTLVKYFIKHKIWESDNLNFVKDYSQFDVDNKLSATHTVFKRDIKKLRIPEDPYQDLSKYVKNKKGVNYVKDEKQAKKITEFIHKINNSKSKTEKERSVKIAKLFRNKRSLKNSFEPHIESNFEINIENHPSNYEVERSKRSYEINTYEKNVDKPNRSQDIFKDISYYVKNRQTTNYNRDFLQAAQVRAGLEQIFLRPDIEVVRRYGSNYNPAVPDPLIFGAIRSAADN